MTSLATANSLQTPPARKRRSIFDGKEEDGLSSDDILTRAPRRKRSRPSAGVSGVAENPDPFPSSQLPESQVEESQVPATLYPLGSRVFDSPPPRPASAPDEIARLDRFIEDYDRQTETRNTFCVCLKNLSTREIKLLRALGFDRDDNNGEYMVCAGWKQLGWLLKHDKVGKVIEFPANFWKVTDRLDAEEKAKVACGSGA